MSTDINTTRTKTSHQARVHTPTQEATMIKTMAVFIILSIALVFASAAASACPKNYHQCGSFCCGD